MAQRAHRSPPLDAPRIHEATEDDELLERVVGFYQQTLRADASAKQWLAEQGVGPKAIEHFQIGLANRSLGPKLPIKKLQAGARVRRRLRALGVLRSSGHEHLNGCVVVPLRDEHGKVAQVFGHRIASSARRTDDTPLWLHDDRRGLLGAEAVGNSRLIVAASIIDALVLWSFGYGEVTAIHGLDGPTDALAEAVQRHEPDTVVLAWPGGTRAERAIAALRQRLAGATVRLVLALLPASFGTYRHYLQLVPDPEARLAELLGPPTALSDQRASRGLSDSGHDASASVVDVANDSQPTFATPGPPSTRPPPGEQPTPDPDDLVLQFDDRRWRIRGLVANRARGTLRVNVLVTREGAGLHMDVFDVCSARHRAAFVRAAAVELSVEAILVQRDLAQVLLALEKAQDELLTQAEAPTPRVPEMTDAQRAAATDLLEDPRLLDRTLDDLAMLGVVGERDNLAIAYLSAISRILRRPLAVAILSGAAAGKSSVLEAVLSLVPPEDRIAYSAMTGQSLYYMGATDLQHKVLSIAEEHGVRRATYALKLLQSEGQLTLATTGNDSSGRLVSHAHTVRGPVALMMTTTSLQLDEELQSRCIVLTVDESPEQTRRIHDEQRRLHSVEGLKQTETGDALIRVHHNAQRLLRPLTVVYPESLDLAFADLRVQARRDFRKLLGLIDAIAVLHQDQASGRHARGRRSHARGHPRAAVRRRARSPALAAAASRATRTAAAYPARAGPHRPLRRRARTRPASPSRPRPVHPASAPRAPLARAHTARDAPSTARRGRARTSPSRGSIGGNVLAVLRR